jgi:hypothetical protein
MSSQAKLTKKSSFTGLFLTSLFLFHSHFPNFLCLFSYPPPPQVAPTDLFPPSRGEEFSNSEVMKIGTKKVIKQENIR